MMKKKIFIGLTGIALLLPLFYFSQPQEKKKFEEKLEAYFLQTWHIQVLDSIPAILFINPSMCPELVNKLLNKSDEHLDSFSGLIVLSNIPQIRIPQKLKTSKKVLFDQKVMRSDLGIISPVFIQIKNTHVSNRVKVNLSNIDSVLSVLNWN